MVMIVDILMTVIAKEIEFNGEAHEIKFNQHVLEIK